ncbi:MipA/OmpV family protein [Solimicrobium silvestre]|uniref:MltA-interacting protein MipA n=1 Tax=Solimicrobium silvestre TaxID=2099400 RepID=A0A2S9H1I9_9BURK|nr:MipA/OmpV family protein [Solimicrobium silvestre]PRC93820.1 MltA-interacting protein MipA [Solimicrobium silvestre]
MKKIFLLLLLLAFDAAHAQTNLPNNLFIEQIQSNDSLPEHSQDNYVGVYLAEIPKYQGSTEMESELAINVHREWSNGALISINTWKPYDTYQIGMHLNSTGNLDYGVLLGVGRNRASFIDSDGGNKGKDWMPFVGGFLNYKIADDIQLSNELLYYFGQYKGGQYDDLNLIKSFAITDHQSLALSVGTVLGNQKFANTQFGISPDQSAEYGYPAYTPSAGVQDVHFGVNWRWSFSSAWTLNSSLYASHLTSNVSETKQVKNENNGSISVGLAYRF